MRINLDLKAFTDVRIKLLSKLLGFSHFDAIGRLAANWQQCTLLGREILSREEINTSAQDDRFADFLLRVDLAETVADRPDNLRLRGVKERIEWIKKLKDNAKKGGIAKGRKIGSQLAEKLSARRQKENLPTGTQNLCPPAPAPALALAPAPAQEELNSYRPTDSCNSALHPTDLPKKEALLLVEIWNAHSGVLPKIQAVSKSRSAKAKMRFREKPDAEYWRQIIERMARSRFLCGQIENKDGQKAWVANFDWLIRNDTNHVKVSEGNYDDTKTDNDDKTLSEMLREYDAEEKAKEKAWREKIGAKDDIGRI